MFDEVFQHFLGSQGGSHGRVRHHMKFTSYYALHFKDIADDFPIYCNTVILLGKLGYVHAQEVKKKTFVNVR